MCDVCLGYTRFHILAATYQDIQSQLVNASTNECNGLFLHLGSEFLKCFADVSNCELLLEFAMRSWVRIKKPGKFYDRCGTIPGTLAGYAHMIKVGQTKTLVRFDPEKEYEFLELAHMVELTLQERILLGIE